MAKRIPANTEVVVSVGSQGMQFRGTVEAAKRVPNTPEWKYLISYHDLYGHAQAGWWHETEVEVDGQTSLSST